MCINALAAIFLEERPPPSWRSTTHNAAAAFWDVAELTRIQSVLGVLNFGEFSYRPRRAAAPTTHRAALPEGSAGGAALAGG
jgi:hypothetical protein